MSHNKKTNHYIFLETIKKFFIKKSWQLMQIATNVSDISSKTATLQGILVFHWHTQLLALQAKRPPSWAKAHSYRTKSKIPQ